MRTNSTFQIHNKVFALDDMTEAKRVLGVFGPYVSRN
jgi:hypothetical protein